jgi:SEC-C motif
MVKKNTKQSVVKCPYCHSAIEVKLPTKRCLKCKALYHASCWTEYEKCSTYGCNGKKTELKSKRRSISKEVAHNKSEIGRNDPCPCKSGRKYKVCCLPKQPIVTQLVRHPHTAETDSVRVPRNWTKRGLGNS